MTRLLLSFSGLCVFSFSTACTSYHRASYQTAMPGHLPIAELQRSDYTIGEPVEGEGCVRRVLFVQLDDEEQADVSIVGPDGLDRVGISGSRQVKAAKRKALFQALKNVPEADAIVAPQWSVEDKNAGFYRKSCAKVKAKWIGFNTDLNKLN